MLKIQKGNEMNILSNQNTSFGATFKACPAGEKETVRQMYDRNIAKLENAKKSALKTLDCMAKSEKIQNQLERMPESDQLILSINEHDIDIDGNIKIQQPKMFYVKEDGQDKMFEITSQDPQEIEEEISTWLDEIENNQ